jgi:hypothetical protein
VLGETDPRIIENLIISIFKNIYNLNAIKEAIKVSFKVFPFRREGKKSGNSTQLQL